MTAGWNLSANFQKALYCQSCSSIPTII